MWVRPTVAAAFLTAMMSGHLNAQAPVVLGFLEGDTRVYVQRAIAGAGARLTRPDCQEVLDDFTDGAGQPLSTSLAATGRGPAAAFALLRFYDDRESPQCYGGAILAFTQVRSLVIRVCGRYFKHRFLGNRVTTELIMIHEFLHTLGLGENPPTSQDINKQVAARCGDRRR
jgi:hypothetical protein